MRLSSSERRKRTRTRTRLGRNGTELEGSSPFLFRCGVLSQANQPETGVVLGVEVNLTDVASVAITGKRETAARLMGVQNLER